jgi:hypothetical protein
MKLNIESYHFEELVKRGYSLDLFFLLKLINEKRDISSLLQSAKINNLYATLKRKELITENEDKITTLGQDLIVFMNTKIRKSLPRREDSSKFAEWWDAYPGTNSFSYKGQEFKGERSLRVNKDKCREEFDKIILSGEYTEDELIKALNYQVNQIKERSVEQRTNKLTYLQNSLTYLNQRTFDPFVEIIREGKQIEEISSKTTGATDI